MLRSRTATTRSILFVVLAIGALAACDDAASPVTSPRRIAPTAAPRLDLSDTLACRSGYVIIDGRVLCNNN